MGRAFVANLFNVALGIWLMGAPTWLAYATPASINDRIVGPLIITFATVAIWEATRSLHWVNLPLGLWLLIAPWILDYPSGTTISSPTINSIGVGILVAALSLVGGEIKGRYGGGWSILFGR